MTVIATPTAFTRDRDFVAVARELAELVARDAARRDAQRILPHDAFVAIRQAGLGTLRVPAVYGGPHLDFRTVTTIFVELAAADPNVAQALIPHVTTVERLAITGTDAQKQRYFARILAGDLFGVANAEQGGKVRGSIATTLKRDGDAWRLDGRKFYSTGSLFAQHLRISALNEEQQRVAVLIPSDRAGVRLFDDWDGMGQRTTASGTTELVGVLVHDDEIQRGRPWHGLARDYTDAAVHLLHASLEVGIARAALQDAVTYARTRARPVREAGVEQGHHDPFVQQAIGGIAARTHAAGAFLLQAADAVQRAADAPAAGLDRAGIEALVTEAAVIVSEIKIVAAEAALKAAEALYEVGGASITRADLNHDRHWRNARTHTTHDPLSYRAKAVGAYLLDGTPPPVGTAS